MQVIVLTSVRLLGDGLVACMSGRNDIWIHAVVSDVATLRVVLASAKIDLVLIDVTHGIDLFDVRSLAAERPDVALVALGLAQHRQEIIRCGRAGFTGYISREASVDELCKGLSDVISGRLSCSAEISASLLRALFQQDQSSRERPLAEGLTRRESAVLELIGQGLSNKEIARELVLSVATVKHHVHNILGKLNLPSRVQAMRRMRDSAWSHSAVVDEKKERGLS